MGVSRDALKDLFFAALDRPADDRDLFLASATDDAELLAAARELLVSHARAGTFLERGLPADAGQGQVLAAGQRLGPYEVIELIGRGGMGEVYRARDTRLGRHVAIKVLPEEHGRDKAWQQRFETEARAASALNHPNVLTVYDVGTLSPTDGTAFIVMELLEGETLRARLQHEPRLSREEIVDLALQVSRGLTAAHAAGVVHRDLKPENLFLTTDSRLKILDFGVAKAPSMDALTGLATTPGTVIGTVGYMAPEQVRGGPADARSDIFALGAVLFEMLTCQRAFAEASSIDTLNAILTVDPMPRAVTLGDPSLRGIIRRCLEKAPEQRYQNASAVTTALESVPDPHLRGRPARRLVVAASVFIVAMGAAVVLWSRQPSPAADVAVEASPTAVLAILPFDSIATDQSQGYFTAGMTEEISAQLARVSSLRLMSSAATKQYASAPDAPKRLREDLGVGKLLTGSVRFAGERARISVQLIDTSTVETIWSRQYDRRLEDVLAVQGDVAAEIAMALDATLSAEERQRVAQQSTRSPAAYQTYLKAVSSGPGAQRIALLRQAIQLDPTFAVAYAGLSRAQGEAASVGDRALYAEALAAARKAIELDPNEARGHHALATVHLRLGHLVEARVSYLRALELAPNFPDAAWDLSVTDAALGRFDESLFWARRGFTIAPNTSLAYYHLAIPLAGLADAPVTERWLLEGQDRFPRSARIQYMLAEVDFLAGKEPAADARARQALAANPGNSELQLVVAGYAFLMDAPDGRARVDELFRQAPDARTYSSAATMRTLRAYYLLKDGDTERAATLLAEARTAAQAEISEGSDASEPPLELASIAALRGDRAEALRWLQAAYRAGDRHFRELKRDPFFASLRSDPEFLRLMRQMESDVATMRRRVDLNANPAPRPTPLAPR